MGIYAGIELGGTKIVCGVGTAAGALLGRVQFDTADPQSSLARLRNHIEGFTAQHGPLAGLGIGAFGPVHLDRRRPRYGRIGATPKTAWRDCDIVGFFSDWLSVPVTLDTDVTAAAVGEATWGAAVGCESAVYITVGTGIGAGALVGGSPIHGLLHPEVGHIRVPRADGDSYVGGCPYHADCIEGMAAGPAILARWGKRLDQLPSGHIAFEYTEHYLSHLVVNIVLTLAPERIVIGGGVMSGGDLYPQIRNRVGQLLNGYLDVSEITEHLDSFIVPPGLGGDAGLLGAIAMAMAGVAENS